LATEAGADVCPDGLKSRANAAGERGAQDEALALLLGFYSLKAAQPREETMKKVLMTTALISGMSIGAFAEDMTLPPLKPQPSPRQVVAEHLDALNKCDWNRLMAQYPPDIQIYVADGALFEGRKAVGDLFAGFCKSRAEGGLKGLTFKEIKSAAVGDTLNVKWSANADFLAEPYVGADAYETKDGLMVAQVTTFDGSKLKFK